MDLVLDHVLRWQGRRLHCLEWPAEGPTIVCLHNQWGTADIWADRNVTLLARIR